MARRLFRTLVLTVVMVGAIGCDQPVSNDLTINHALVASRRNKGELCMLKVTIMDRLDRPGAFGFYEAQDSTARKIVVQSRERLATDSEYVLEGALEPAPKGFPSDGQLYFRVDSVPPPSPWPWFAAVFGLFAVMAGVLLARKYWVDICGWFRRVTPEPGFSQNNEPPKRTVLGRFRPVAPVIKSNNWVLAVREVPSNEKQSPSFFNVAYEDRKAAKGALPRGNYRVYTFGRSAKENDYHLQPEVISRTKHFAILAFQDNTFDCVWYKAENEVRVFDETGAQIPSPVLTPITISRGYRIAIDDLVLELLGPETA